MVQRRHGDPDIRVPLTEVDLDLDLVVVVVSVKAEVLTGASGRAPAGVEATGEALAGAPLTPHGEAGSVMRCC